MGFPSALKGKAVGLIGVAAGRIGAIKSLEALKGCVSHVGGILVPSRTGQSASRVCRGHSTLRRGSESLRLSV